VIFQAAFSFFRFAADIGWASDARRGTAAEFEGILRAGSRELLLLLLLRLRELRPPFSLGSCLFLLAVLGFGYFHGQCCGILLFFCFWISLYLCFCFSAFTTVAYRPLLYIF